MIQVKSPVQESYNTSSVVNSWSLIGKHAGSSNDSAFTEPRNSSGASDHIKSETKPTFHSVVFPSSYL